MAEVVTIGETMVMFSPNEQGPLRYVHQFKKRMAGSETNVAIGLSRLNHTCAWLSRVGDDEFGRYLLKEIQGEGVDVSQVKIISEAATGIMFKELHTGKETRVYYYRQNSAASTMIPADLNEEYIAKAKILHLTGITPALSSSCLDTIKKAIAIAKENKVKISFDLNIRLKLWEKKEAIKVLLDILPTVDILLPGLEEAELLLGLKEPQEILDEFLTYGVKVIALKLGEDGSWVANSKERELIKPYPVKQLVDPIGAGDAFAAGFLTGQLEEKSLIECGKLANAMGAFAVSSYGDIEGLPSRKELDSFIQGKDIISR